MQRLRPFAFAVVIGALLAGASCGSSTTTTTRTGSSGTYTPDTVGMHAQSSDCWIIVNGAVYDVTKFIPTHPGGPGQILPYCGRDATIAFSTQGGRGGHSPSAQSMLATYKIGTLTK